MPTTPDALVRARRLYESGECSAAETLCCEVLAIAPNTAAALHLQALIALKRDEPWTAVEFGQRAIEIEPEAPEHRDLLGTAYRELGEFAKAEECYLLAIRLDPNLAASHNNLGACLFDQGQVDDAVTCYERAIAIDPQLAAAHFNLGNAKQAQKQFDNALACYESALQVDPNYGSAHANLGAVLLVQGQVDLAQRHLERALELLPDSAEVHNNLGALKERRGDIAAATALYRTAIHLRPDYVDAVANLCDALVAIEAYAEAVVSYELLRDLLPESAEVHNNLGVALQRGHRLDEAIRSYERAIELEPQYAAALSNLGAALHEVNELPRAEAAYRQAIAVQADLIEAHVGLAKVLDDAEQYGDASECFARAVALAPNNAEVRFAHALALLQRGDFDRGWKEYEWRWKTKQFQSRDLPAPRWGGEPLLGRTILIHAEQGLGDTIQFVRYLPLVKACGGTVIFAANERLQPLLKRTAGADKFIALGHPMPQFDVHAPLLSLPHIFKSTLETIPATVPYLTAERHLVDDCRDRLQHIHGCRVGVCWQGNPENQRDKVRSIPFHFMQQLADIDGVTLISLQHRRKSASLGRQMNRRIIEISTSLDEAAGPFMETAAIMMNLDLVVSCDTAVAHLAGALGVQVWLAIDHAADWRWMRGRTDSPWYPTMRLVRQSTPGDWDGVIANIGEALRGRVEEGGPRDE
ncbi:MAG: tetratricopeptide repeat protein [Planctomycetia bacterium]|nr:tetratricopeptide repeat protein [Planctomycetia bacterium]